MARKAKPIQHGTAWAYQGRGCRCDACRAANAAAQRQQRPHPQIRAPRRSLSGLENSLLGEVNRPTKSIEAMIGQPTPEQMHCRVLMRNGETVCRDEKSAGALEIGDLHSSFTIRHTQENGRDKGQKNQNYPEGQHNAFGVR
jgi:hypothetical protein